MKIGNHVIRFHKTEFQKRHFPGDKEQALARMPQGRRPRDSDKPPMQLEALTPYNRLPSIGAVNKAIDALPEVETPREVVDVVHHEIQAYVAAHGRLPQVLILGDRHGDPASSMATLAAIHEYRNVAGPKTLSFERTLNGMRAPLNWLRQRPRLLAHCVNYDVSIPLTDVTPNGRRLVTAGLLARAQGFDLQGIDPKKRTAADLEEREEAMLNSIVRTPLGAQGVHVIVVGSAHVPLLHEKLSPVVGTLAIATLPQAVLPGETKTRDRMSYLLSTPDIVKIKPSPGLRDGTLDATKFIRRELAPWVPA
jgi:hypothetical protein